ncbi:MAG: G5 domain-containing protein [Patescibacteria group bacterium]|nr:G5 domain-containing protein [Patescibacteria group bacterium]
MRDNAQSFKLKIRYLAILLLGLAAGSYLNFHSPAKTLVAKVVTLQSRGFAFQVLTESPSVSGVMTEQAIPLTGTELSLPAETPVVSGMVIDYRMPVTVSVDDGGQRNFASTTAGTVEEFLNKFQITLGPKDEVTPDLSSTVYQGMRVRIVRVAVAEEERTEPVDFTTVYEHDPGALYGSEVVVRDGSTGEKRVKYSVRYRNGQEVSRKILASNVTKEPTSRIVRRGSRIEVETQESGRASWYVYKGCLCAAHPYFPKGSWLRVTALSTGKSIIVRVNDRGPDQAVHPGRILDLDAAAFKQLATLGTGTIEVKVEKLISGE